MTKANFFWGIGLWFFGYILGIILFPVIPTNYLGWAIMPLGLLVTVLVLLKKFKFSTTSEAFVTGLVWSAIAITFDFIFLVLLFQTGASYYKLDVFIYYLLTLILPLIISGEKTKKTIWFGPKKYGWGWVPITWQGWLIALGFITLVFLNMIRNVGPDEFVLETFLLAGVLIFICYKTGEKPYWRWGK